ncbi:MAG TPA: hypothetical protein VHC68_02835 [Candidatus Paceibacterota bacterium]|nr:hypothetical protein [Candidatus Paceibacterota bacterium]
MSRSTIFIILGLIVLIAPFSGLYHSWIALVEALCGIGFVGFGIAERAAITQRSREAAPVPPAEAAAPLDDSPHLSPIA